MTTVQPLDTICHLLRRVPLIEGHNDLAWQYMLRVGNDVAALDLRDTATLAPRLHTDLRRLRAGRVGAQFWAAYVPIEKAGPGAAEIMFEQIETVRRFTDRYADTLELALSADDIERVHADGKIASLIGVEGGHGIENSLARLRDAFSRGARYMTLVHNIHTDWADCCVKDPRHSGLTDFGREVVTEMNRLGMIVDLSHSSPDTMRDAIDVTSAPIAFTHSGARAVNDHPRNVPDDVLERVRDCGGVVMATFVPYFVSADVLAYKAAIAAEQARLRAQFPGQPERRRAALRRWRENNTAPTARLAQVADHIDHLRAVMGIDHIGIGSDFDGITEVPDGLEDVSAYPALFVELYGRGYSETDLEKIAGRNFLRLMRAVESTAQPDR